jgi:hypothetical protein
MGRIHLHSILEGRFLIREPDFHIRRDVYFATQEEGYQAGVWAFNFLADRAVVWLTVVFEQLQTPGARVPPPRRTIDTHVVFKFEPTLMHAVVQLILVPWTNPFE